MVRRKPSSKEEKKQAEEETDDHSDIFEGPLKSRRYGLRIDDIVEVQIIAGNTLITLEGRILSMRDDLELLDLDGFYHKIYMDWVVDIKIVEHNRPRPDKDPELVKRSIKPKVKKASVDHAYN